MTYLKIVLARRAGEHPAAEDFEMREGLVPRPRDGEVVVRHSLLGLAPSARLKMAGTVADHLRTNVGDTIHGAAVGIVTDSRNPGFVEGTEVVSVDGGWQTHGVSDGSNLTPIDTGLAPAAAWLGPLGNSGFSAYAGLLGIGRPSPGETVMVSSAAGAVGSVAAQIASLQGCQVVGVAGGEDKCRFVEETYGVRSCVDRHGPQLTARLQEASPQGVDVYFDNVGGAVRDSVWPLMNRMGRVVVCGQISHYGTTEEVPGPGWDLVLARALRIEGLDFSQHLHRYAEFRTQMGEWIRTGEVVWTQHQTTGLDSAPGAFIGMLQGRYRGKVIVRL